MPYTRTSHWHASTLQENQPKKWKPICPVRQVIKEANCIILGSPARQGGMCAEMRLFLDSWAQFQTMQGDAGYGLLKVRLGQRQYINISTVEFWWNPGVLPMFLALCKVLFAAV